MSITPNKALVASAIQPISAPVREQVVARLRNAILTGELTPGERLVELTLSTMLNVSRASIREAVRQLEAEKLVTITPFKGPSVATMTVEQAWQIYEVRSMLESQAAAICAERATHEDLSVMKSALKKFEKAARKGDAVARIEATDEFYASILACWDNAIVADILAGLQSRINYLRYKSMALPDRASSSLKEMTAIFEAVVSRSPLDASAAAKAHVNRAFENAKAMLETVSNEIDR